MNTTRVDPLSGDNSHHWPFEPDFTVPQRSSTSSFDEGPSVNHVVVGILIGMIVVLSLLFVAMTAPVLVNYARRRWLPDRRIERRYRTVEGWLISKKARKHEGELCGKGCQEEPECSICMEEIRVGDVVSWSPSGCDHFFHHECIKECT